MHRSSSSKSKRPTSRRTVVIGSNIGTSLEWFDFGLFGIMSALVFPDLFFPNSSASVSLLQSFATFGVGLAARPLGAAVFAHFGDRVGRRRVMVISLTMMGASSLLIACLPGYETIGVAAPALLVLLRLVQGFSLGGESSAAQVMTMEYAPPERRGLYGSLVNVGSPLGQVLIAFTLVVLRDLVSEETLQAWAWRLPFALGAVLAVVGYVIRLRVNESPVFTASVEAGQRTRTPLIEVVRQQPRDIGRLVLIGAVPTVTNYLVYTYSVSYMSEELGLSDSVSFSVLLVLSITGVALVPLGGWLSDRWGRKPVLCIDFGVGLIGVLAYFALLDTGIWPLMLLAALLTVGVHWIGFGAWGATIAEPFPTATRYSGHASVYSLANLLGGAPTPFVATLLVGATGTTWSITGPLAAAYVLALGLLWTLPETRGVSFDAERLRDPAGAGRRFSAEDRSLAPALRSGQS